MSNNYDIIIVGAGPAGSSCAYHSAKDGLKALLIEKHERIGNPVCCGEGISKTGLENFFDVREEWIASRIEGAVLVSPSGRRVKVHHPDAGYILNRKVFDRDLAMMAVDEGAELRVSTQATELLHDSRCDFTGVKAISNGEEIEFQGKVIIAADGVESRIGKLAGINTTLNLSDIAVGAQYYASGVIIENSTYPEFYVGNTYAPGGYAWIFPKGEDRANIGLGIAGDRLGSNKAVDYLDAFVERFFPGIKILEKMGGIIPTVKRVKPMVQGNVMLIGDAAHITDPNSGAGISNAMRSGKLAAQACAHYIHEGAADQHILKGYEKAWDKEKGREHEIYLTAKNIHVKLNDKEFEDIVELLSKSMGDKTFLGIDVPKVILGIIFKHPRLLVHAPSFLPHLFKK
ncbi:NAD(P)/FAD-dependent oxidoreductase [bacterium]|nr:NAD(P)/FAD-dependent oxidoreductase [bacterium]